MRTATTSALRSAPTSSRKSTSAEPEGRIAAGGRLAAILTAVGKTDLRLLRQGSGTAGVHPARDRPPARSLGRPSQAAASHAGAKGGRTKRWSFGRAATAARSYRRAG